MSAHGLPADTTLHDLRHTFASTAQAEGVPISEVSRWLGHKSITTTVDLYGHLVPEATGRARDALDKAFRRATAHVCPKSALTDPHALLRRRSWPHEVGESACRPGSVPPLTRGGGHPSRAAVADSLVRSTREHRAGRPRSLAQGAAAPLLTLLRVGFTEPPQSPAALVVSYTTVSPLPPLAQRRSVFCGTVPRVTPGRRYRPPCPVEPGPSSPGLRPARPPGRLTRAQDTPNATGPE